MRAGRKGAWVVESTRWVDADQPQSTPSPHFILHGHTYGGTAENKGTPRLQLGPRLAAPARRWRVHRLGGPYTREQCSPPSVLRDRTRPRWRRRRSFKGGGGRCDNLGERRNPDPLILYGGGLVNSRCLASRPGAGGGLRSHLPLAPPFMNPAPTPPLPPERSRVVITRCPEPERPVRRRE